MIQAYYIEYAQKRRKRTFIIILLLFFNLLYYTSGVKIAKIGVNSPIQGLSSSINERNNIKITQSNTDLNKINDLDIFCNSEFNGNKIIAPESIGSYTFQVENTLKKDMLCNIKIDEINKCNINIKCKIKKDGTYILGDENTWIDVEELLVDSITIANDKSNYTLEWYWESSENDTEIAKLAKAEYKLNINVNSTQV